MIKSSQGKRCLDLTAFTLDRYNELYSYFNQKQNALEFDKGFIDDSVAPLAYDDVNHFIDKLDRTVNIALMNYLLQYLELLSKKHLDILKPYWLIFTVSKPDQGGFTITNLGNKPKTSLEIQEQKFTHVFIIVIWENDPYLGIFEVAKQICFIYMLKFDQNDNILEIYGDIVEDTLLLQPKQYVDCFDKTDKDPNQRPCVEILFLIQADIISKSSLEGSTRYTQTDLDSLNERIIQVDWLLLESHFRQYPYSKAKQKDPESKPPSQRSKPQTQQTQYNMSKNILPSELRINQTKTSNRYKNLDEDKPSFNGVKVQSGPIESPTPKPQESFQSRNFSVEQKSLGDVSFNQFIYQLKQQENEEKRLKEHIMKIKKYGEQNVELSKQEFVYMMQKFKQDVIKDLKAREEDTHPLNFLQMYLYKNGSTLTPQPLPDGRVDYNVQLTPDQLADMLKNYESFQKKQEQAKVQAERAKKEKAEYEGFVQFQQLLNYYYYTNPTMYQQLLEDYNSRLQQKLLNDMGLSSEPEAQLQPARSQVLSPAQFNNGRMVNQLPQALSRNKSALVTDITSNFVAQRYEKKITKEDFRALKIDQIVNETILNFFIRYLEERQQSIQSGGGLLQVFGKRILFLTSSFYRQLCNQSMNPSRIDYDAASFYTQRYMGKGNTIFDKFDQILMPVAHQKQEFFLVSVNFVKKEIIFYDSLVNGHGINLIAVAKSQSDGLMSIPSLVSLIRFIEQESMAKVFCQRYHQLMKPINILRYSMVYSAHEKVIDTRQSGLLILSIIYQLFSEITPVTSQRNLSDFHSKLSDTILQIGVTRNRKNELNDKFDKFSL